MIRFFLIHFLFIFKENFIRVWLLFLTFSECNLKEFTIECSIFKSIKKLFFPPFICFYLLRSLRCIYTIFVHRFNVIREILLTLISNFSSVLLSTFCCYNLIFADSSRKEYIRPSVGFILHITEDFAWFLRFQAFYCLLARMAHTFQSYFLFLLDLIFSRSCWKTVAFMRVLLGLRQNKSAK